MSTQTESSWLVIGCCVNVETSESSHLLGLNIVYFGAVLRRYRRWIAVTGDTEVVSWPAKSRRAAINQPGYRVSREASSSPRGVTRASRKRYARNCNYYYAFREQIHISHAMEPDTLDENSYANSNRTRVAFAREIAGIPRASTNSTNVDRVASVGFFFTDFSFTLSKRSLLHFG